MQKEVIFTDFGFSMSRNKLKILSCLAIANANEPLNAYRISKNSGVERSVVRHHIEDKKDKTSINLMDDGLVEKAEEAKHKSGGLERKYRITTKGLILVIVYETHPETNHDKYPKWKIMSSPDYTIDLKDIEITAKSIFKRKINDGFIDFQSFGELSKKHFGELNKMLEANKILLGIEHVTLKNEVLDVAQKSILFAAYTILADFPILSHRSLRFPNGEKMPIYTEPYEVMFISRFLFTPVFEKWQNWEKWLGAITEKSEVRKKLLVDLDYSKRDMKINIANSKKSIEEIENLETLLGLPH